MADWYDSITDDQATLIKNTPLFFVASANPGLADGPDDAGPVNISPRGGAPLHVLGPNRVAFVDYAGSGNETARHSIAGGPVTVMVCSFEEGDAAIVRLYGRARVTLPADSPVADLLTECPSKEIGLPVRQVIEIDIERTMTSCGFGVPVMSMVRERRATDRGRRYRKGRSGK